MTQSSDTILTQAKEHFYALRLLEAYALFRRFFDRLPFQPEEQHAEYIGMFARVLAELGKTSELKFYMGELERWHAKLNDPAITYQLAVVYSYLPEPRIETARRLFEDLMRDPNAQSFRLKARMMLADYYDGRNDLVACRHLIYGIELDQIGDPILKLMYQVWRAKILRDEEKFEDSKRALESVLDQVSSETNWYVYWWTKIILARLHYMQNQKKEAHNILTEVRSFLKIKRCRSLENHIRSLEEFSRRKNSKASKRETRSENKKIEQEL